MPYMTSPDSPETSQLKMEHVVFDEISFVREGFQNDKDDLSMSVSVSTDYDGGPNARVKLRINAIKPDEYKATIAISGFCVIDGNCEFGEELIKKNAVAILFPYVRAELTLLTAQPETNPIVLPPININGLIDNSKQSESN